MGCKSGQGTERDAEDEGQKRCDFESHWISVQKLRVMVCFMGSVPRTDCETLHLSQRRRCEKVCEGGSSGVPTPGNVKTFPGEETVLVMRKGSIKGVYIAMCFQSSTGKKT